MEFNNKTILITGLIICSIIAMYFAYKDIALSIVSGLIGYLSKEIVSSDSQNVSFNGENVPLDQGNLSVSRENVSVDTEVQSVEDIIEDDGETA